jgi:hypothetical protein
VGEAKEKGRRLLASLPFATLVVMDDDFELIGGITEIEVIAVNLSIREHKHASS